MRPAPLATALVVGFLLTAAGPTLGDVGVSPGPDRVIVLEPGWTVQAIDVRLDLPTNLEYHGGKLLIVEAGRYHYASPYDGQDTGRLRVLALDEAGAVTEDRIAASGLADPIGLAISPDGDAYVSEYGRVSIVNAGDLRDGIDARTTHSWGYPAQTSDFIFLPVTGTEVQNAANTGETAGVAIDTTGPMGLTFSPGGQLFVSQAIHGTPPDPVVVRDVTGNGYDNPYSSAVLKPAGGELTPDQVAARSCRNCYDLDFAPDHSPHAGELFITENVGAYRLRASAGYGRTVAEGSTATDQALVDGVNHVDPDTGQIRRVALFHADVATGGVAPVGMAFAPADFPGHAGEMFVAVLSGFGLETNDRGMVSIVHPDLETGAGRVEPFVVGLDQPIDVAFGPDGELYVIEFANGRLYRVTPTG